MQSEVERLEQALNESEGGWMSLLARRKPDALTVEKIDDDLGDIQKPPDDVRMFIDGVKVIAKGLPDMTEAEATAYISHVRREYPNEEIVSLTIENAGGGQVSLDYKLKPPKFERIRRITGYLVGDMGRWNNAKSAEERDRVKHEL